MESSNWEMVYRTGGHNNSWPWSDMVSLFHRYRKLINAQEFSILDLGSGTGNNYPFWKSLNSNYFGIDISQSATDIFLSKYPEVGNRVICGDFSQMKTLNKEFDVICDRGAITCGSRVQVSETIPMVYESLKKGGIYLGIDWYSKQSSDFSLPSEIVDENSRRDVDSPSLGGIGTIHFANKRDMLEIFSKFEILELSEKVITRYLPHELENNQFASWNIVARKP